MYNNHMNRKRDLEELPKWELLELCKKQRFMLGKLNREMREMEEKLKQLERK